MTDLLYKETKWGVTFEIMSTGVHEYHKWIPSEDMHVLTVEPIPEMIRDLNRLCRHYALTGNGWTFEGCPDFGGRDWLAAEYAQKRGILVKMCFEFVEPKMVPLFKLMWHGR